MRGVFRMKRGQPWRWRCSRSETFPCDYVQFHHGLVSPCYDMPQSGHGSLGASNVALGGVSAASCMGLEKRKKTSAEKRKNEKRKNCCGGPKWRPGTGEAKVACSEACPMACPGVCPLACCLAAMLPRDWPGRLLPGGVNPLRRDTLIFQVVDFP